MAPFGFTITKKVTWRGQEEQFSNVYHYDLGAALTEAEGLAMLDAIVAAERPAFGTNVTFVQGRAFGPTNAGQAANNMVAIKDYTGAGTQTGTGSMPFEETLVVENYIGRGPAGRKQFLRKYLHICRVPNTEPADGAQGNAQLTGPTLAIGTQYWNRIKAVTANSNTWKLCTRNGKPYDNVADSPVVLPYLHIRQFKQ